MNEKKQRTQIAFDIDINIRQELKVMAARRGTSMCSLIKRILLDFIRKDKMYNEK